MSYVDNPLNDENQVDTTQKWDEPFADLLNEIYYLGYAKNLAKESPEEYSREFWYFVEIYTK